MGTNLEIAAASNQPAPPADLTGDHRASAMPRTALGRTLWRQGTVSARQIAEAEASVRQTGARLADHLRLSLFLPAATITQAEADVAGAGVIDPAAEPPQPHLVHKLGASACLRHGLLPWRASGGETIVITARPDRFDRHRDRLTDLFGPVRMAISTEPAIQTALGQIASSHLVVAAETLTATEDSCRTWSVGRARLVACATLALFVALTLWSPAWVATVCVGWAVIAMIANIGQRIAAAIALAPKRNPRADTNQPPTPIRLPVVTIFVPLFQEKAIAGQLIANLSRLDYPSALLDVCILLEEDDHVTRDVLDRTNLPRWLRAITVPRGTVKTKPRALNYGLNFARGEIIGVYDAEDAPDPDQIRKMVAQFAASPPEVACLQGVLDFYNTGHNWLARCFTIEYATWFRLVLPGLARLGFVIPLGGTTLFFRRSVLEEIGGWDAHNVTEDADLGVRLARRGYRTELLDSATMEEANASAWPWVKQRSRWLKGYAITYCVHMRNPRALWRDLGAKRFFGVQVLFLGTLSQFALAPLLWSFWLVPLGMPHPLASVVPGKALLALGVVFFAAELLNIGLSMLAVSRAGKRGLLGWVPTLHLYYPLAVAATYKGLLELFWKPFYWDKTAHGAFVPHGPERSG